MSTGKRLAKRSILGTRVMVPGQDDLLHPGLIQAVKTYESGNSSGGNAANRYSVRFEEAPHRTFEFSERDIVGQGFRGVSEVQLSQGQRVYVTHNQREMMGRVVRHDFDSQEVLVTVNNEEETVLLKIDDVRLLESRKSARLVNSDTDFSKLADLTISNSSSNSGSNNGANNYSRGSKAIEVPRSDYVQIAGSRKRRTSENVVDDEEVLSECSAAMLLMKLSCSPHSPAAAASSQQHHRGATAVPPSSLPSSMMSTLPYMDLPSPSSSSGASSFRSPTPSPPLSTSVTDEGIVKDLSVKNKIVFQCTFPGCQERHASVHGIESHVRKAHMHRPEEVDSDDEDRDHEEEFYYTEIEVKNDDDKNNIGFFSNLSSLADHMDMARPAHEDPGLVMFMAKKKAMGSYSSSNRNDSSLSRSLPNPSGASFPVTLASSPMGSPGKLIVISPPIRSPHSSGGSSSHSKSPNRRPRDGKKCRKVYGLEQRDMWCTQCKWKKACARFGSHATEPLSLVPSSSSPQPSLLSSNSPAVLAIKF